MDDPRKVTLFEYDPRPQLVTARTEVKRAKYATVDAHNHLRKLIGEGEEAVQNYVQKMDESGVRAAVDLDGGWGKTLDHHIEVLNRTSAGRFYVFCRLDWSAVNSPGFSESSVELLEDSVRRGAVGLKISKRLGLDVKTGDGGYLPVDTPLLDPVWERCGELGIPVLIHTSDPSAFFTTLDRHNERLQELADHPDWMFDADEYYTKEELLAQRNRVIARHPQTTFIGAHVANLPENLRKVREWFERYPNLHVDISARLSELGRQPYTARRFLIENSDRILFGTDGNAMGQPPERMYRVHWRFFETDDEYFDVAESHKFQGRWRVHGLHLPDDVLEKLYYRNFLRLIPRG